jgi:heme/copper-type cytochrome/quinol oxidase subunit 2
VFVAIVAATVAGAAWLMAPVLGWHAARPTGGDAVALEASMSGFSMRVIRARAGHPLTVRLTSLDTRFHTDGGGTHQFAIDALGVNLLAPPRGTRETTFTPVAPGTYTFYCDVCCGGRANPTMVGTLIVEA